MRGMLGMDRPRRSTATRSPSASPSSPPLARLSSSPAVLRPRGQTIAIAGLAASATSSATTVLAAPRRQRFASENILEAGRGATGLNPEAAATRRSVRDPEQGVYEYLEEKVPSFDASSSLLLPMRLSGWLWRREGIFRKFRRRFCVFKADHSALFVFAGDDTVNGKLLRRIVITRVQLMNREERAFDVQGYAQNREVHRKQSASMAKRASRNRLAGDRQRFFLPEEEHFKAVSSKSLTVWTHCFKHHMRSYPLRKHRRLDDDDDENGRPFGSFGWQSARDSEDPSDDSDEDDDELDPDFVYEEVGAGPRRRSLPALAFRPEPDSISRVASDDGGRSAQSTGPMNIPGRTRGRFQPDDSTQLEYDQDRSIYITKLHRGTFGDDDTNGNQMESVNASKYGDLARSLPSRSFIPGMQQHTSGGGMAGKENVFAQSMASNASAPQSSLTSSTKSIWVEDELLERRIDFDAITKTNQLATGAFGEVWLAKYRSQDVVVKHLKDLKTTSSAASRRATQRFIDEIKIHARLEHKRIVRFLGVAWTMERDVEMVMEYLPKGDLRSFLDKIKQVRNNKYSSVWTWTKYQWRIAIDVIEGLVYLHSLSPALVHGDLKGGNILLREDLSAKLGDFGLSRYLDDHNSASDHDWFQASWRQLDIGADQDKGDALFSKPSHGNGNVNSGSNESSHSGNGRAQGTARWMAPEILTDNKECSMAADVYAFGVVLSEIDTCELPFRDRSLARSGSSVIMSEDVLVHHIVSEGWKPTFRVTCPDVIKQLAAECLSPDPKDRPTSLEVAYRLRKAATQRERPDVIAAQAASLRIH